VEKHFIAAWGGHGPYVHRYCLSIQKTDFPYHVKRKVGLGCRSAFGKGHSAG
jgi:hypothetical protein